MKYRIKHYIKQGLKLVLERTPQSLLPPTLRHIYINKFATPIVDKIYPTLTNEQEEKLDKCIRISFTGDLILLRDVIENGRLTNKDSLSYDFSDMFTHISKYWKEADFNIAVLEGPLALNIGSISNTTLYDKTKLIELNFPDEFGQNIKNAGIDLVTLATNHILDKKEEGLHSTIERLNRIGLNHCGAYRNPEEKENEKIKILTIKGLKIAILSYTYGCNSYPDSYFFEKDSQHYTNIIVSKNSAFFKQCLDEVIKDFNKARSLHPDCIICLPHWGGQGEHIPNKTQEEWMNIFINNGADIILGDHPHAVQPICWKKNAKGRNVFVAYCPGNFVNSYIESDGDASMIIEVYLSPDSGEPISSSIIPLYAYTPYKGITTGLPIFDIINNKAFLNSMSQYDYNRMAKCHKIITHSAISETLSIDQAQSHIYYFPKIGYVRNRCQKVPISTEDYQKSPLIKFITNANSICFMGDSITEGTKNGGYGWFEPIMSNYPDKKVYTLAKGGATSQYLLNNIETLKNIDADLFIIAIGCNDIRYRNPKICAMNSKDYINNINAIIKRIQSFSNKCKFIFIEPWYSDFSDEFCNLKLKDKEYMYNDYSNALHNYCIANEFFYITPNKYIWEKISNKYIGYHLVDHIHPNAKEGIQLYSRAVIKSSYNGKD